MFMFQVVGFSGRYDLTAEITHVCDSGFRLSGTRRVEGSAALLLLRQFRYLIQTRQLVLHQAFPLLATIPDHPLSPCRRRGGSDDGAEGHSQIHKISV